LVDRSNYKRIADLSGDVEAIITVKRGEDVTKGGAVFLNEQMELVDLVEKNSGATLQIAMQKEGRVKNSPHDIWYNAGLYMFRPSIFEFTAKLKPSPRGEYELTDAIRELAHAGKKVKALELSGDWADVRDPEILERLNR
jgi:dTDP-glucose pyrophosphorylase